MVVRKTYAEPQICKKEILRYAGCKNSIKESLQFSVEGEMIEKLFYGVDTQPCIRFGAYLADSRQYRDRSGQSIGHILTSPNKYSYIVYHEMGEVSRKEREVLRERKVCHTAA